MKDLISRMDPSSVGDILPFFIKYTTHYKEISELAEEDVPFLIPPYSLYVIHFEKPIPVEEEK